VILPVLLVVGLAYIFSGPERPLFKVAVIKGDAALSAELHPFVGTRYVQFFEVTDQPAAIEKVSRHQIDMLLDLRPGQQRYWVNDTSPKGYVLERLLATTPPEAWRREAVSGAQVRYVDWLMPGILGMNMMFSCLFGVGYVIVRYRKAGYLKRLNATPVRAIEFIGAQVLSRLLLIMTITVAVFAGTHAMLDFRMEGSYFTLFLITLLGASSMIALAFTIAARVTSEELAGGLLNVLSWPMMFLSGVWFSLEGTHRSLHWIAQCLPLTHLLDGVRAIMLDGAGLAEVSTHLAVLAGMTVVFLAIGARLFRWTQD
jgi:ABC-type multidrug transport system permease subunit